jgi:hypothetical protein
LLVCKHTFKIETPGSSFSFAAGVKVYNNNFLQNGGKSMIIGQFHISQVLEFIDEFEYDFWFVLFTYPPVIATR